MFYKFIEFLEYHRALTKSQSAKFTTNTLDGVRNDFALKSREK